MEQRRIGRYQILEEVASGGQATVYRAWDTSTGQVVGLKVMHPHLAGDPSYLERFRREARLAASVRHPNVVRIFEVGSDGDIQFISMEYLPLSVHDLIQAQGSLPIDRAVDIGYQIALALESAHQHGIVHRDIKPQNILLAPAGTVKVSDFGIARAANLSTMTRTGALMGTPHYMAPEQAKGERATIVSDLYSLGVVLYQMLTGEVPFDAETPWEVIRQHIEAQPARVRQVRGDVPRVLERLVSRSLEKNPSRRYATPGELAQALREAVPEAFKARPAEQAPVQRVAEAAPQRAPAPKAQKRPATPPRSSRPKTRRSSRRWFAFPVAAAAAAIVVVAATAAVSYFGILGDRPKEIVDERIASIREAPVREVVERAVEVLVPDDGFDCYNARSDQDMGSRSCR